ncbi:MAG: HD domain-containing protein [Weeksellaceae bacterium]|nr:HD domain-containing protein [Weeksellaceae bacterium]
MNLEEAIQHPVFEVIREAAEQLEKPAYVVGGFVRDVLMGRPQKFDIDILTEGSGIDLAKKTAKALDKDIQVVVFKRFGTAMFSYKGMDWEFVGARKESYSPDSRKPAVENGSLQDDQQRRDFTINAMAISLNADNYGLLLDPFEGEKDLQKKIIRTPLDPNITYSDDPLRMMRAIRFAAQLNFDIEHDSFVAIGKNAARLDIVSRERIMSEFNKIMLSDRPGYGLQLLHKTKLLERFLPELTRLQGVEEIEGNTHKDNLYHTFEVVDNIAENTDSLWLRWAALLHDIGKAPTKRYDEKAGWTFHSHEFVGSKMVPKIFRRLSLPMGPEMKYVKKLVHLSSRPIPLVDEEATDSALRRLLFDAGDDLEDLFTLCKADITTKNAQKQQRYKSNFNAVLEKLRDVEERDQVRNFQPPVSGEDIMKCFGIKPGEVIGTIKSRIKEAILEGELVNDREQALEYMKKLGAELGLEFADDVPKK